MAEANWFDVMSNPEKHGYKECPHCHGYGSSLKEEDDQCTMCRNSLYKGLVKKEEVTDEQ